MGEYSLHDWEDGPIIAGEGDPIVIGRIVPSYGGALMVVGRLRSGEEDDFSLNGLFIVMGASLS
jgi:hypothetical protein